MNIQIFGTVKCFDTKKAQRYFKERGIKYQFIDMKEKGMSRGFGTVKRALGFSYFFTRGTQSVRTESLLHFLVYNMKRAINQLGTQGLMEALRG